MSAKHASSFQHSFLFETQFKAKVDIFAASAGPAPEVGFSPEQLKTAAELDKKVKKMLRAGGDNIKLLSEMHDDMHRYTWLLDTAGETGMTDLCERFRGLHQYSEVVQWFFSLQRTLTLYRR